MNLYLDSSVVLRAILGEPGLLPQWRQVERAVSSELLRLECLRTIDRARLRLGLPDREVASIRSSLLDLLSSFDLLPLDPAILLRAAEPFPTTLGSLDAIHLASALHAKTLIPDLELATHDLELAIAASATGFRVFGAHLQ